MVDLVEHVWNVDTSVRFSTEVELIRFELRVFFEETKNDLKVVLSNVVIIKVALIRRFVLGAERVANSSWLLDVENISL